MPEIIPKRSLKISKGAFHDKEQFLVYLKKEGSSQLIILGLKEWLKSRNSQKKKELKRACG